MDYSKGDTLKRSQYVNIVHCRLVGKEERVSRINRLIKEKKAYYSVITDKGIIHWYGIEGTASLIRSYPVYISEKGTNITEFVDRSKWTSQGSQLEKLGQLEETGQSVEGDRQPIKGDELNKTAELNGPINSNGISGSDHSAIVSDRTTQSTVILDSADQSSLMIPLSSTSILVFSGKYCIVEAAGRIFFYVLSGEYLFSLDMGIDKASSIYCSLCSKYLFITLDKGMICLFDIINRSFIYRNRHPIGDTVVFGDVFSYLRYFTVSKNSLIIGRVADGEILLELTYPEEIACASTDILQRKIAVGSVTGKIFYSRIDNELPEFTESKISASKIENIYFSLSGRYIFAISNGFLTVIDSKNGKVVKSILSPSSSYFFSYTTSSNLHLN